MTKKDKDFINYFRKASEFLDKDQSNVTSQASVPETKPDEPAKDQRVEFTKDRINEYLKLYPSISPDAIRNLIELKDIAHQKKQNSPDESYQNIKDRLGDEETGETLRQERWRNKVRCIKCGSKNIKRLPEADQKSKEIFRYKCLDCEDCFNDDSETELEKGTPPLYSWMFCWYLLGCTSSMQYIANKLNLDISTIEMMVSHMQKLFKSKQPLNHFLTFDEFLRHGKNHQVMLKESLAKKQEMLSGYSVGAAKDQHEVDRQKNRNNPSPKNRGS